MTTIEAIQQWIKDHYQGGLIPLSEVYHLLSLDSIGEVISAIGILKKMEDTGEVEIIVRHFCPDSHYLGERPPKNGYCPECDYNYPLDQLNFTTYIKPLKVEPIPTINELTSRADSLQQKTTEFTDEMIRDRLAMAEKLTALEEQVRFLTAALLEIDKTEHILDKMPLDLNNPILKRHFIGGL